VFTLPTIDWQALEFRQPEYLWLLIGPALLLVIWVWQFSRRRADIRRYLRHRAGPVSTWSCCRTARRRCASPT
jgi:hypothetical protein